MPLKDQLTSLDVALKLKQLGVRQESTFAAWIGNAFQLSRLVGIYGDYDICSLEDSDHSIGITEDRYVSLFTVAELGLLLPAGSYSQRNSDGMWEALTRALYGNVSPVQGQKTEADARGKLLVAIMEKYSEYLKYYRLVQGMILR